MHIKCRKEPPSEGSSTWSALSSSTPCLQLYPLELCLLGTVFLSGLQLCMYISVVIRLCSHVEYFSSF